MISRGVTDVAGGVSWWRLAWVLRRGVVSDGGFRMQMPEFWAPAPCFHTPSYPFYSPEHLAFNFIFTSGSRPPSGVHSSLGQGQQYADCAPLAFSLRPVSEMAHGLSPQTPATQNLCNSRSMIVLVLVRNVPGGRGPSQPTVYFACSLYKNLPTIFIKKDFYPSRIYMKSKYGSTTPTGSRNR